MSTSCDFRRVLRWQRLLAVWTVLATSGCGGSADPTRPPTITGHRPTVAEAENPSTGSTGGSNPPRSPEKPPKAAPEHADRRPAPSSGWLSDVDSRATDGLFSPGMESVWVPPTIDDERMAAVGISKHSGKHLTLYTDLRDDPAVVELPRVFDQAVPLWCRYFDVPTDRAKPWRMVGYLILDKDRFRRAGLLPDDLPPFLNGFQRIAELWLYEQPTEYYRRHLLLHEGTHGFMRWALGGCGPPWYMEGTAELLATHRWRAGALTLGHFPASREETPYWGRIKIIKADMAARRGKTLEQVMRYDATAHLQVEPYAWCWAAATFFDSHPATQTAFRNLRRRAADASHLFSQRFRNDLESDWSRLTIEWQLFASDMDYGYSLERERLEPRPVQPLPGDGATVRVTADRGWQSSGYRIERGMKYRFEASGRYQVASHPKIWWCEPNGVTIRYHNGRPLGVLLGAIVDEERPPEGTSTLLTPIVIGPGLDTTADRSGTLYLRINDSGAELEDNAGELTVSVQRIDGSGPTSGSAQE
ncbi:MAG: hypothetical protein ACC628_17955 [Pirellulaceae bacterium]